MATLTQPQQPDLRAFVVYDRLPEGYVAFPVTDMANAPHLRPGDIAIIDPTDREPQYGELFLIAWGGERSAIVETWTRPMTLGCGPNGEYIETIGWLVAGSNRPRSFAEASERLDRGGYMGWVNGTYATEGPRAGYLNGLLRGKVVGVLEPAFDEPMRQIGRAA
ncbi:hypothetical protein [Sphingomonas beigongshangi]|uniref:hypothetical protein n=1 Tax=Sphingomonas beigongshangi TaxID=2782540 RepID=UPI00193C3220|nr:hypothetical protein [Sphingomonas beigongshangi]